VDARDRAQLRDGVAQGRHAGAAIRNRLAHRPLEDGDEQVVLAAEIQVHGAGGDAGGAGDVGDLGGEEPPLGEDVDGGAEDGFALVGLGGVGGSQGSHGSH
jgi:hypothetical protein